MYLRPPSTSAGVAVSIVLVFNKIDGICPLQSQVEEDLSVCLTSNGGRICICRSTTVGSEAVLNTSTCANFRSLDGVWIREPTTHYVALGSSLFVSDCPNFPRLGGLLAFEASRSGGLGNNLPSLAAIHACRESLVAIHAVRVDLMGGQSEVSHIRTALRTDRAS